MSKKTVVIFGISSFMGSNLAEILKQEYRVIGTYSHCKVDIPGVLTVNCDVLNRAEVQMILYTFQPDITVYTVGLSSLQDCHENEKLADALNSSGVYNVLGFAERYKSKFCYISSSFVFPGVNTLYSESETPLSNTVYGHNLASTEFYIQKSCLNYLILRTCPVYGRSYNPRQLTYFEALEKNLNANQSVLADARVHHGFLDATYLASIVKQCFDLNVTNRLLQISTPNIMNRYQFAQLYAKQFKQNELLVSKFNWQFPFDQKNTSAYYTDGDLFYQMNISNIESLLKMKMPTIEESMEFTYKRLTMNTKQSKSIKKSSGVSFI